jgi:hypothetical protein
MRWILALTLVLLAAGLFVWRFLSSVAGVLPAVFLGMVAQFGVLAEQALNDSFVEIQQNEAVAERLGGPLTFPKIEDVVWENPTPQLQDQIICRFVILGPKLDADVRALLKTEQDALRVVELQVVPQDDGQPIEILPAPN